MTRTIITDAALLTVDGQGVIPRGDLVIEEGVITQVGGRGDKRAGDEVIAGDRFIATPGFVNAHAHLWQTAMRGNGLDWAGTDYYQNVHATFGPAYTPEDSRASERLGALNQILGGVTTVYDWVHNNRTPEHSDASLEGIRQSGIRAVFGHGTVKSDPPGAARPYWQVPHPRSEITRLADAVSSERLIEVSMCMLGPDYAAIDVVRADLELARELGIRSSAHVWGKPNRLVPDGYRRLVAEGLVDAGHNVAHANYFADDEIRALIDAGASFTSTPAGEVAGTEREPLVRRVLRLGGRPSLGNDSELGGTGDMVEVARRSLAIHRLFDNLEIAAERAADAAAADAAAHKLKAAVGHDGGALQETYRVFGADALRWLTLDGARALGLDSAIGSLTVGKRADIVLFDRDHPALAPAHDPIDAVVSSGSAASIDTVLIDGVVRKRGGALVDQAALRTAVDDARSAGERVRAEIGR